MSEDEFWEALRLANFDRNPPIHGPWLNVIPDRPSAGTQGAPEYTDWYGQWAVRPSDFNVVPWSDIQIATPYTGGAPTTEDVA